jgi:thymidylate synthase (FAD)
VKVVLLQSTPEPERLVALAARLCYSPSTLADLAREAGRKDVRKLLDRVLSMGHESVTEHACFTFGVEGISRAASHQLVRHRIASYSQQSQRYVAATFGYVTPVALLHEGWRANRRGTAGLAKAYRDHMEASSRLYERLLAEGIPAEDARFVLPNASETRLLVTMNARELNHFFSLRLCRRAQWEIRDLAAEMLRLARDAAPLLFARSGPGCVRGKCPEGKFTCGKAAAKTGAVGRQRGQALRGAGVRAEARGKLPPEGRGKARTGNPETSGRPDGQGQPERGVRAPAARRPPEGAGSPPAREPGKKAADSRKTKGRST